MASDSTSTRQRIKEIIVESLSLEGMTAEMIGDDTPLWADGLGLDSVDALELVLALEQEYGFRIDSDEIGQETLATVAHLETFVNELRAAQAASSEAAEVGSTA